MVTISLTTDWGASGLYTGLFKAKLVQRLPGVQIVDISHQIEPYKVPDAVFALKNAITYFAPKTIHIVSVASMNIADRSKNREFICFQYNYQYFIGPNNGLWEMLFDDVPEKVYKIEAVKKNVQGSFSESDIFVDVISKLSMGLSPERIGVPIDFYRGSRIGAPEIGSDQIKGSILYFDGYGNGITNISQKQFEDVRNGRFFTIFVGRKTYSTDEISENYMLTQNKIIALFNSSNLLELAVPYYSLQKSLFGEQTGVWIMFFDTELEKQKFSLT